MRGLETTVLARLSRSIPLVVLVATGIEDEPAVLIAFCLLEECRRIHYKQQFR